MCKTNVVLQVSWQNDKFNWCSCTEELISVRVIDSYNCYGSTVVMNLLNMQGLQQQVLEILNLSVELLIIAIYTRGLEIITILHI